MSVQRERERYLAFWGSPTAAEGLKSLGVLSRETESTKAVAPQSYMLFTWHVF